MWSVDIRLDTRSERMPTEEQAKKWMQQYDPRCFYAKRTPRGEMPVLTVRVKDAEYLDFCESMRNAMLTRNFYDYQVHLFYREDDDEEEAGA